MFAMVSLWTLLTIAGIMQAVSAGFTTADSLAASNSLTSSSVLAFPNSSLSSNATNDFIISKWGLSKGQIQHSPQDLSFVSDPFPDSQIPSDTASGVNASTGPVLKVNYPAKAFSADSSGVQFLSLFNGSQPFQSMLLTYDVAFDKGFNWTKGGKLPGIRGGKHANGCFGGSLPNGTDCFSIRLDWRPDGEGEANAFIPNPGTFCNATGVHCTSGAGISIAPSAFSFQSGGWNRVSILVRLNDPPSSSNGDFAVYFNDVPAISQSGLQFRIGNEVNATGLVFSTFFGGEDSSWAPPTDQHAFFRNIQLWGGPKGSNDTDSGSSQNQKGSSIGLRSQVTAFGWIVAALMTVSFFTTR